MSDGAAHPPSTSAPGRRADQSRPPSASPSQTRPASSSQRTGGLLERHPVWVAIGALAAIVIIFGGAFTAGRIGARNTDLEQTTIGVISAVDPSVVQVQGKGSGLGGSVGSGEILTSSGYIVTNSHVVHGLTSFTVLMSNGQSVPARVVGDVPTQDLAVLKVTASDLKPIAVADSSHVEVGQYAIAMGSPLGLEQSATTGIVSALDREGREVVDGKSYTLKGMIQTSAPINPGNSGGALVNSQGQLIGIPTLAAVDPSTEVAANGIGFAISSNTMKSIVAPFVPSGS